MPAICLLIGPSKLLGIGLFSAITATLTSFMLTTGAGTSPSDRLRELPNLRDAGLLTDEEYAAKRAASVADL